MNKNEFDELMEKITNAIFVGIGIMGLILTLVQLIGG